MNTRNVHDRLNGIEAFVQAAEAGSFALAAERLRLTRSAVGKSIARLEARLGVRLFHRTTRQQSLTDDGQAYYDRCVRALAELQAAEAELDSGRREPQGRLRVTAPLVFGRHCVAPVLRELAGRYPQLEVDISFSDRVVDLIDEGYDLGIRVGDLPDSSSLAARRLGLQTMGIGASPAYIAAHGRPVTAQEMQAHAGIIYARGGVTRPGRCRTRMAARHSCACGPACAWTTCRPSPTRPSPAPAWPGCPAGCWRAMSARESWRC